MRNDRSLIGSKIGDSVLGVPTVSWPSVGTNMHVANPLLGMHVAHPSLWNVCGSPIVGVIAYS